MNKAILMGRLTRDPDIRYSQGADSMAVARFTLAVDRRMGRKEGAEQQTADFISCVAFGKTAEFAEKYLKQGTKVAAVGRIQSGSYTNKDGQKIYTTDVILDEIEFAESKGAHENETDSLHSPVRQGTTPAGDGIMNIPDGIDEELPFN